MTIQVNADGVILAIEIAASPQSNLGRKVLKETWLNQLLFSE